MSFLKWFYPGMGIKRWLVVAVLGLVIFSQGLILLTSLHLENYAGTIHWIAQALSSYLNKIFTWAILNKISLPFLYLLMLLGGLFLTAFGIWGLIRSLVNAVTPQGSDSLVNIVYQQRSLSRGLKIVAIGGGTGLSTLLRGLKEYTSNIVAIVTVSDDGGSSGRLRKELGVLPPGDIRNCLVALADSEHLGDLLQYRFGNEMSEANGKLTPEQSISQKSIPDGEGLLGHSFGNLFLVAMTGISGDFLQAIKASSRVLAIRGKVLPATSEPITLCAELNDGTIVEGESAVSQKGKFIQRLFSRPLKPKPLDEVLESIKETDAIIFGPGSLYTSILPNLLVQRMTETIRNSSAVKIFVCNCMTQPGETDGFTASDHLKIFEKQLGKGLIEFALVNTTAPSHRLAAKYREAGAEFVKPDLEEIQALGIHPVPLPLINESELVRHDSKRLAEAVMKVILEGLSQVGKVQPKGNQEENTLPV